MKIWIVLAQNSTNPDGKFFILGAHSTAAAAEKQKQAFIQENGVNAHVEQMQVDGPQPPILIGSPVGECVKDTGDQ